MHSIRHLGWIFLLQSAAMAAEQPFASGSVTNAAAQTAVRWKDKTVDFLIQHGPAMLGALVVMMGGWILAGVVYRIVDRTLQKRQLEQPIRMLIARVVHLAVLCLALIVALDTAGFKMTTLIAGISVVGVGVGLAMQGVLGNLVAGLLIIFTKPYRVGEYIDIIGEYGQVEAIELFSTVLAHPDRSRIFIPNRKIIGEVLHNYGTVRQVDLVVGVSYDTDVPKALETIRDILRGNSRVVKEIPPAVGIADLGESAIDLAVKPWVAVADYGAARAELCQAVIDRFRKENIQIPFPQHEVRILNGHDSSRQQLRGQQLTA